MEQALAITGHVYSSAQTSQLEILCNYINMRVARAWDWAPWPELMQYEERAFAAPYEASRTYVAGDVVWDSTTEAYYEALSTTTGNAVTNPTYWDEVATPTELLVEWEQYGQTKISRVFGVYTADPRTSKTARSLDWINTADGVVVPNAAQETVWVAYVKPASRYTSAVWSGSASYSRYDLVFYPGDETSTIFPDRGDVYMAEVDVNGVQVWNIVPFPAFLQQAVSYGAAADMERHYGTKERALEYETLAERYLADEWDKVKPLQKARFVEVS